MTAYEAIKKLVKPDSDVGIDMDKDSVEKLIYLAYWIGREEATKYTSDLYNKVLADQIKRAQAERYRKLAMRVQGNIKYVYTTDYSQDMTNTFGDDETNLLN